MKPPTRNVLEVQFGKIHFAVHFGKIHFLSLEYPPGNHHTIRVGTFESMIFRLDRGGICDRSQEGIHYCTFSFVVVILDILLFSHVPGSPDFPQPACGTSNCVGLPPKRDHLLGEWGPPQLK